MTIGFGVIAAAANVSRWGSMSAADRSAFDPLATSLLGVRFGVLAIGVLGVLLVTGEYTTGMIRSTMTAVPKRLPVLRAKAAVYALVALLVSVPSVLIAFFAGQVILSGHHIQIAFSHAGVARAVIGAAAYLALAGLFALGLGAITRNTGGGIATFAAVMFVTPPPVTIRPSSIANSITPYLPSTLAMRSCRSATTPTHPRQGRPWPFLQLRDRGRRVGRRTADRSRRIKRSRHTADVDRVGEVGPSVTQPARAGSHAHSIHAMRPRPVR